ncbi:porin [Sediminibacterium sp.]|uniref:porin n=1 Tax=Sediminibacterium sp. TaxID=1917865 RepID=UPI00273456DD|nr:porin [Sediminibacterium sp.]MDP3392668.1 porin [Sediminibacterium sp.]MDP3566089.1 porin [Sediminibacterium sp.]
MKCLFTIIVWCICLTLIAQPSDSAFNQKKAAIQLSGYAEVYYQHNSNGPTTNNDASFAYSHDENKALSINLAFVKAAYDKNRLRANLAIGFGSYMRSNYAGEEGIYKQILEANIGWKLNKKANWWLDAGVFTSHIGFESAIGKDCWTLSRSIAADNSPYFETGAKISYTSPNEKWFLSALVLTGWQRIQMPKGNTSPSFGHQIQYKPNSKWTINSSSFIGVPIAGFYPVTRYFHNLYALHQWTNRLGVIAGFDIGLQKAKGINQSQVWYTPILMAQFAVRDNMKFTLRTESYQDPNGAIIYTGTANGFRVNGISLNADWASNKYFLWRVELKHLQSGDLIFTKQYNLPTQNMFTATTALAVSF